MRTKFGWALAAVLATGGSACTAAESAEVGDELSPDLRPDVPPNEAARCVVSAAPGLDVDCSNIARVVTTGFAASEDHFGIDHLRLEDGHGESLGAEYEACLVVVDEACTPVVAEFGTSEAELTTTLLVRAPYDADDAARLHEALVAFGEQRPQREAIAVFRWGHEVTQVASASTDRARLAKLVATGLQPESNSTLELDEALSAVSASAGAVFGAKHRGIRRVVVVAAGDGEPFAHLDPTLTASSPQMVDLVGGDEVMGDADDWTAALLASSDRAEQAAEVGEHRVRRCLPEVPEAWLQVVEGGPRQALASAPSLAFGEGEPEIGCGEPEIDFEPTLPARIELEMSITERAIYDQRVAEESKEPFVARARSDLAHPHTTSAVTMKLRGNGSLACDRKSYSLEFDDGMPRHLMDESASDRFFLISMCLDDRYVNQFTAYQLMAERGSYAPAFRMIELVVSGQSHGVYLLVERPQNALERDHTRPRMVVRRGADMEGEAPEIKFAVGNEAQAEQTYEELMSGAEATPGPELLPWLRERMDVEQYLRWLALMSLLQSGDYVDELYLTSTEVTGPDGERRDYFHVSGWDQDDIFKPCHNAGMFEYADPHGLAYCAEARLDYAMLASDEVYALYVDVLEEVVEGLDEDRFAEATQASAATLLSYLEDDSTRLAMWELLKEVPEAAALEVMEEQVHARANELQELFAARRALLRERIAAYRAGG